MSTWEAFLFGERLGLGFSMRFFVNSQRDRNFMRSHVGTKDSPKSKR